MQTLNLSASDSETMLALHEIAQTVSTSNRIIVVTGAGISTSCGIPDFRSSDGLYALVKQKYPGRALNGRNMFDASLFLNPFSTAVFYRFISKLKESVDSATPSPTHWFLRNLDIKGKLIRLYTQNIDGLETRAGLLANPSFDEYMECNTDSRTDIRSVHLHGDIHRVRCILCFSEILWQEEHQRAYNSGVAPDCPECLERVKKRAIRCARPLKVGTLRPAIVLYGEEHPLGEEIANYQSADIAQKPELLLIMGTSLDVYGIKQLVRNFARSVLKSHKSRPWMGKVVFVNRTAPAKEWWDVIDYHVQADCDDWVERVEEDWKRMKPEDFGLQIKPNSERQDQPLPVNNRQRGEKRKAINSNSIKFVRRRYTKSPLGIAISPKKYLFSIDIHPISFNVIPQPQSKTSELQSTEENKDLEGANLLNNYNVSQCQK